MAGDAQGTPATPGGGGTIALAAGQRVGAGRYTLQRLLGQGGMGQVWLAKDEELGDQVALKFVAREISLDADSLDDLRRETLKSRKLTHSNIIRIHDLHRAPGEAPFISMEYVDGQTLSALKAGQPQRLFAWEYLQPLVRQLCDALDYAHRHKVIHRDLKPANMMVNRDGELRLADFGIAAVASDSISRLTQKPRDTSGTPAYMSPQQMEGQPPRVTDDVYALGATLYELLTSKPPFYHGNIVHQVKNVAPVSMEQRLADLELSNAIPADVAALVMACLSKDPERRPQNAGTVAEWIGLKVGMEQSGRLLESVVESAPLSASQAAVSQETRLPTGASDSGTGQGLASEGAAGSSAPRRTGLWIGVGVTVLLVLGLAGWLVMSKSRGTKPGAEPSSVKPSPAAATGSSREHSPPHNMVLIPAGPFQMGDSSGDGLTNALPVHTVHVSAFYMDKYEVTKALWNEVYQWATNHGYQFDNPGDGEAANHPVHSVNWYDCVKWCNARSEKAGRVPAYYMDAERTVVYRGAQLDVTNEFVKWDAGYRLPTEAEWEKAARGGLSSKRFPWGDTISHSQANYISTNSYNFDVSVTRGFYPAGGGSEHRARTTPVDAFSPNGYGLYNMSGNLSEWCWDYWDPRYYSQSPAKDPRGYSWNTMQVLRGGSWGQDQGFCRSAGRHCVPRDSGLLRLRGFRTVLSASQSGIPK